MIEILVATIVGQTIIGPNQIQTDYLISEQQVVSIVDTVLEVQE